MSEQSQGLEPEHGETAVLPAWAALPLAIRQALLSPESWHESLDTYACTTHLAVALADTEGRLLGPCLNPQPTWNQLHATPAAVDSGCPFALALGPPCTCVRDALRSRELVLARDRTGLVHFTVPLVLGDQPVGVLLAGQVFDRYPEQLLLEHAARHYGVSSRQLWQRARLEPPVKQATLHVYGRLLETLGNTFLQTRYYTLLDTHRLEVLEHCVRERTAALAQAMAEQQRLAQEAQRAEHFSLLGRLAAGVSHEIRNPLGAVFLNVDLLAEEIAQPSPDSPAAVAESLAEIKTNLARLDDLVQDYLALVRVGSLRREVHDLGAAIQTWATELQQEVAARGVTIVTHGLPDLGPVAFHTNTLRRALLNLVQNAADAMPQGGTVTLRGRVTATHVQLQVQDTGGGIPAAMLPRMFEPLYTTKPGGTGLGLYIVQEIVTAHEGQITVESVEGQGTTFTLTLPRPLSAVPD